MSFNALVVRKDDDKISAQVESIEIDQLPDGDVTVAIDYSTVNYKDGLCIGSARGLVHNYPHVPGIDFAGRVESSLDSRYALGDRVVLTGWRVGETWWGGYSQKARVKADWLVTLPEAISCQQAMAVGTAGFTAMLAVMALEDHGLTPDNGIVLVTGATGGVGSVATAILSSLGYQVAAVTGRPENSDYLIELGASQIIAREEINEIIKRPLESERWAGCIDAVGGTMLARILGQLKHSASIASVGLAGGATLPATVMPFLLRGVNLLGIDSVMQSYQNRVNAWDRIAKDLPFDRLNKMISLATLADLPTLATEIINGRVRGRVVVDVNR